MKIFDCFTFFNELDILEIRLTYLFDKVDFFVLVESDITHSGNKKPFLFEENKDRFKPFLSKIIHIKHSINIQGSDSAEYSSEYAPHDIFWKRENEQRNAISKGLIDAMPNDIVMIGDVDEIPSKKVFSKLKRKLLFSRTLTLQQDLFLYFINCKAAGKENEWKGTVVTKFKYFESAQYLRDKRYANKVLLNGGWHLSYMGGVDSIVTKIQSFAHTEFNKSEFLDKKMILQKIKLGQDIYNREGHSIEFLTQLETAFPSDFLKVLNKYPSLMLE